ncbi:hypothetical protein [Vulcanisaeta distributa]|nr:hypothetical protein [Vulcanisaeta distributa]
MRGGVALRIDYGDLSMDYVYDYITMRISSRDITHLINGSSIISVS